MSYVVRTSVTPARVLADVRRAVAGVDANLALAQVRPLQDYLATAAAQTAFTMGSRSAGCRRAAQRD